jgi:hypothetical protein
MSHLLVYATTDSQLDADVLIVRLKDAGIATALISVLHPNTLRPDSTVGWVTGAVSFPLASGELATVSGMLGLRMSAQERRRTRNPLVDGLRNIGLTLDQSLNVEESLLESRIVVAVEASDESELPAIFHTLRGLAVEKVQTTGSVPNNIDPATRPCRYRRVYEAADLALAHFSAA